MKNFNLLGLFVGIVLFVSCSSEEGAVISNSENGRVTETSSDVSSYQKISLVDLKDSYLDYIASVSYLEYKDALDEFVSKMNYDGNTPFTNTADISLWISNNINKTDFADYDEAKAAITTLNDKFNKVLKGNSKFFADLSDSTADDFFTIVNEPVTNLGPCEEALNGCTSDANAELSGAVLAAVLDLNWNDPVQASLGERTISQALQIHAVNSAACARSYVACVN